MTASPSPDELRKCHARWHRVYDRLCLAAIAVLAIGGTILWALTQNIEYF